MNDVELVKMVLPYVVSTVVFILVGVGFYLKDVVFNYLDKKRQDHYAKKYDVKTSFKIKQVKKKSDAA